MSSLRESAIHGMVWTAVERLGGQIIQFILGIILARILLPSDYGIIGLLSIFMAISSTLIDSGIGSALIQNKNRSDIDYSTAFYFNALVGIVLYFILFLVAPYIASFYNFPLLCKISRIYTIVLLLNSLTVVPITKLTIELNFRAQSIIAILTQLVSGILAIYLACNRFGVWSLVYHAVISQFLRLVLVFVYTKWLPLYKFSYSAFRKMFSYGSKLLISGLINTIYSNINSLIIGKKYSVSDVGFYNRGYQLPYLVSGTLQSVIMKVAFPIMSEVQDNPEILKKSYEKFLKMPLYVLVPSLTILMICGESFVELILGSKWLPCVPYLKVISIAAILEPLTHINLNILYVKGRTDLVLKLELLKKSIAFIIIIISVQYGVIWLCIGQAIYSVIAYIFNCYYTRRYINLSLFEQIKILLPIFIKAIVAGGITLLLLLLVDSTIAKLLLGVSIYMVSYIAISIFTRDKCLIEYFRIIKQFFNK